MKSLADSFRNSYTKFLYQISNTALLEAYQTYTKTLKSSLRGDLIITISQSTQNLDPSSPRCSHLLYYGSSLAPSNVQNLTSSCTTFTTIIHKNKKLCVSIFLQPIAISPCKLHTKNVPSTFPKFTRIQMILIISDGLRIQLLILTKFNRIDSFRICLILEAKFADHSGR